MENKLIPDIFHLIKDSAKNPQQGSLERCASEYIQLLKPIGDLSLDSNPIVDKIAIKRANIVGRLKTFNFFNPIFPGIKNIAFLLQNERYIPEEWKENFMGNEVFPSIIFPGTLYWNSANGEYFFPALYFNRPNLKFEIAFVRKEERPTNWFGNDKRVAIYK